MGHNMNKAELWKDLVRKRLAFITIEEYVMLICDKPKMSRFLTEEEVIWLLEMHSRYSDGTLKFNLLEIIKGE